MLGCVCRKGGGGVVWVGSVLGGGGSVSICGGGGGLGIRECVHV